ncbi:hypothetical protein SETIT_5G253000v2 [Setaria italica]|uniref:Uncharacterized protein n=1 Tax=Setaria italica TaxID=4555 RepID=A0A368R8M8_SETIT|nr:hypothetical protein SETIT_5G253000v2 [Setaria italica]
MSSYLGKRGVLGDLAALLCESAAMAGALLLLLLQGIQGGGGGSSADTDYDTPSFFSWRRNHLDEERMHPFLARVLVRPQLQAMVVCPFLWQADTGSRWPRPCLRFSNS